MVDGPATVAEPAGSPPLPGLTWDPRVRCWRAPAHAAAALLAELGSAAPPQLPSLLRSPAPLARWSPVPLRGYQEAALAAWQGAGRVGVVSLPTGSGKTRLALAAMRAADTPALVVVPTRALMRQWIQVIRGFYPGPIGRYGDGERSLAAVTVSTYASAWRHMAKLGALFPLLVVDEAHHLGEGQLAEALTMAMAPARLGLTATPNPPVPSDDEALSAGQDGAGDLLGPVVFSVTVDELVGSALAPYDVVRIRVRLSPDERRVYDAERERYRPVYARWRRGRPGAAWRDFIRDAQHDEVLLGALAAWQRAQRIAAFPNAKSRTLSRLLRRHAAGRTLVFTRDNSTTYSIARTHLVAPITCDIRKRERQSLLEDFASQRIGALVSARVLNEGLDIPEADTAVVVGSHGGQREFVQRLGRLLRPLPGKRARIYELLTAGTVDARRRLRSPSNPTPCSRAAC